MEREGAVVAGIEGKRVTAGPTIGPFRDVNRGHLAGLPLDFR